MIPRICYQIILQGGGVEETDRKKIGKRRKRRREGEACDKKNLEKKSLVHKNVYLMNAYVKLGRVMSTMRKYKYKGIYVSKYSKYSKSKKKSLNIRFNAVSVFVVYNRSFCLDIKLLITSSMLYLTVEFLKIIILKKVKKVSEQLEELSQSSLIYIMEEAFRLLLRAHLLFLYIKSYNISD